MAKITKKNRMKYREAFAAIENAYAAVKQMHCEAVLIVPFNHGKPSGFMYHPGKDKRNEKAIEQLVKDIEFNT